LIDEVEMKKTKVEEREIGRKNRIDKRIKIMIKYVK
jgi:hypothetical protein